MVTNELCLFYDEYPSDLLQPDRKKNMFFGSLIHHKGIDENSIGGDKDIEKYLNDPYLQSVSVCIERTEVLRDFLNLKFVSYRGSQIKSIYNTRNFIWCSVFSLCFHLLYKSIYKDPPNTTVFYDPKSLNKDLKQEFTNYFQATPFIDQVRQITNQRVPSANIRISDGNKEMIGIRIADRTVRGNYDSYPDLRSSKNHVKNITHSMDAILKNLLEKGSFSNAYENL
jgi:hypothetical protein